METTRIQRDARPESMLINMGPSHPAMHGTIRIMLELDAERILNAEVEVGYLHRGFEKTCENKTYFNLLPYTDRLNYVSPLINNLGYAMTMEKMLGVGVPERAQLIRVMMSELSRVSDHLTSLAAMAMECGAFTVFLYMMKAREFLWDTIEFTTGARMTTSYIRIGGVRADLHPDWRGSLATAVKETRKVLKDVSGLLDGNSIFQGRTRGVGVISKEDALSHGWTGPCLRSTGIPYDVRKASPYLVYDKLDFEVPVGEFGDNFDRYRVRMREMEQSLRLLEQVAVLIPEAAPIVREPAIEPSEAVRVSRRQKTAARIRLSPNLEGSEKERYADLMTPDKSAAAGGAARGVVVPPKEDTYTSMEGLINHFLFFMNGHGIRPPKGDVYFSVEGGNGEVGFYIVSDGTDRPYRLHLRAPCFHVVSALEQLIKGRLLADVIPTFGSMNMIGGELDR
jgi:NADH-quinone oxidoreductase subunit D